MPYIGMFTEESIQKAINRAGEKLGPSESGLVLHLDTNNEVSLSIVQRMGSHISVEAVAAMDTSLGLKFDKEHLKAQAELIARW